jgi:hemerythrin-like domain-containing protein
MPRTTSAPSKSKAAKKGVDAPKSGGAGRPKLQPGTARDAIALLEADHRAVEQLFKQFEASTGDANKRDITNVICVALKVHARLEEELFYPAAFDAIEDKSLVGEAVVEHASAKDLIAQIEAGAPGEALYDAKVKVLSEYINHHVTEEEEELFPQCRASGMDIDALGQIMSLRKQELMAGFVISNPVLAL